MSRTYRRGNREQLKLYCGSLEEALSGSWWLDWNYPGLPPQSAYERRVAWYRRDHPSGRFGVPSHFTRQTCRRPHRRYERQELHRCIRQNEWDDHLPHRGQWPRPYWF